MRHIDLNTLDSLARTSYLIHEGLIGYRSSLVKATLHCVNDDEPIDPESTLRYRARAGNHYFDFDPSILRNSHSYLPYNGKSGECARDLVSECRRCGVAVCRVRLHPRSVLLQSYERETDCDLTELHNQAAGEHRPERPSP